MKNPIRSLALSLMALFTNPAQAAEPSQTNNILSYRVFSHVWAYSVRNDIRCFPTELDGSVPGGTRSVHNRFCNRSYAWAHDSKGGASCFAVGPNRRPLRNSYSVHSGNCRYSFVWGYSQNGNLNCYGMAADGRPLARSYPVDSSRCQ